LVIEARELGMRISTMPLHLRRLLLGTSALTGLVALASTAQAGQPGLPSGGTVTAGNATIAQPNANQLAITTGTSRTVIDWQSFSIAAGNKVTIQQPGSGSITVNEVTGADPSQIFGDLASNGRVVLANPNGLWFGPDSHVDVAGLVASTATLSDAARKTFASGGRLSLDQAGSATASIVNDGRITIAGQGLAALVAPGVRNNGVIEATLGSVTLASGTTSTLDFYGDGLVALAVTAPVTALAIGPDGKPFTATIENNGKIAAGQVLVTADVVKGVVDSVINMSGVTEAKGVTVSGGDIVLDGGDGAVTVAGTLDATSAKALGGNVQVTGGAVTLTATAVVDASGATGGGTVQIGGGPHGGGTLKHAKTTQVAAGAQIKADATVQGNGGTVSVWSDQATSFDGSISAKGAGTGNGGWVETSSQGALGVGGTATVDTSAPGGTFGSWLLDPYDIVVQTGGSTYDPATDGNTGDTETTQTIDPAAINNASSSVTLYASHNLTVSSPIAMTNATAGLTLIGENLVEIDAPVSLNGAFAAQVGMGGAFHLAQTGSITTLGTVSVFQDGSNPQGLEGTPTGATITIGGAITANGIYLKAADQQYAQAGSIEIQGTAVLSNTETGALTAENQNGVIPADVILYAGIGGSIHLDSGMAIHAVSGNIALIADDLQIDDTVANISTPGSVILAPASTRGSITGGATYDDFTNGGYTGSNVMLQGNISFPEGATESSIDVDGTLDQSGALTAAGNVFAIPQQIITAVSGPSVGQLMIGLDGTQAATTVADVTLPVATTVIGQGDQLSGSITASRNLTVSAGSGIASTAAITAGGALTFIANEAITSSGALSADQVELTSGGGDITVTAPISTTGTGQSVSIQAVSGSISIGADVTTAGAFRASVGDNGSFTQQAGTTIEAGGVVVIGETSSVSTGTITINGAISGAGVDIEASGVNSGAAGYINIGGTASISNIETAAATVTPNSASSADMIFYSGPGTGGWISLTEGASITANAGNIAFITDRFILNTPSSISTVSTPGTVIYSPATTLGSLTGPNLHLNNTTDNTPDGFGTSVDIGFGASLLPQNVVAFLSGGNDTVGGNGGTIGALQIGLPGTTNTTSIAGTTSLPIATTIYGGTISVNGAVTGGSSLTLSSTGSILVDADITTIGLFQAGVGGDQAFTETSGTTISGGTGVIVYDNATSAGATINIGGTITAPEIYLLASDHQSDQAGQITLQGTGMLVNNNGNGSNDGSNLATTILYAGPGGGITLDAGMTINGGRTNVALISDTLTVNSSSAVSTVSTFGRVIVSPASTNGELRVDGTVALPDSFTNAPNYLLDFAAPAGVGTLSDIGVVGGSGAYNLSQTALTTLGGTLTTDQNSPILSVARFQIGLPGATNAENFAGPISLPTETSNFAGNITVTSTAAITIASSSLQTFDTDGTVPGVASGLFFTLVQTSASTGSALSIAPGASITVPGNIQLSSACYSTACAVTPTASIGGSLTTGGAFYYTGSGTDQVTILPGTVISSTGTPDVGGISITAASLALAGTLSTNGGSIDLNALVTLLPSTVSLNTNANGAGIGGDITFESTLDDQIARTGTLILNAGSTGNVSFNGLVGNHSALGAVTITSADNVTGPALNANNLQSGTAEFRAASFTAGSADSPITGAFTMVGGLSVTPATNAFTVNSTSSRTSGSIFIDAAGAVTIGTLNASTPNDDLMVSARGADISGSTSNTSNLTGNGGTVTLIGSGLVLSGVQARGGESTSGSAAVGAGGNGGTILLTATNGNVTILGGLSDAGVSADGGQSQLATAGAGGTGGSITIDASGTVTVPGGVHASGGDTLSGIGGNAGSVTIDAATLSLGRALARGGDSQGNGTGAAGGAGGTITLIATGTGADAIILGGNSSDFSGTTTAVTYGTLNARSGEVGVTDVFGTDVGGTTASAGGTILLEGSTAGGALGGAVDLVNAGTPGVTAPSTSLAGGANILITASGTSGEGGSVTILGSIVAADDGIESLRLGASNGSVTVAGSVGSKTGNRLNMLVLAGTGGAITVTGGVAAEALVEQRTTGSFTVGTDLSVASYTTPLNNTVLLTLPASGNGVSSPLGSLSLAGTFLLATPGALGNDAVTLTGTTVIDSSTNNSAVTLGSVDGAFGLTLNAGTGTVTSGAIGAKTALSSLTLGGNGSAVDFTGGVTTGQLVDTRTSGSLTIAGSLATQSYVAAPSNSVLISIGGFGANPLSLSGGFLFANALNLGTQAVTLTGATVLDTSTNNAALTLGTIDGGFGLTLNAGTAAVALKGAAGAQAALASLTINAGTISLGNVATTGAQNYTGTTTFNGSYTGSGFTANGADILGGATGVTVSGAGNIGFGGTLDGGQNLVLTDANGTVNFGGAVGGTTALGSLTVTANGIVAGSVTTAGAQSYAGAMSSGGIYSANGFTTAGPVVMLANTTVNGGTGDITLGSVNGLFNLVLTSADANIFFNGTIGAAAARLSLLSIAGADNVTVGVDPATGNTFSLFVDNFTASHVAGLISVGNHSLESDDSVNISAGSLEGHATATDLTIVTTGSVSGNFVATGNSMITTGGDFSGSLQTRSGSITSGGTIDANVTSTTDISLSAPNVEGTLVSGGLAQIFATQSVSANINAGSVDIRASGANVSGPITATSGPIDIVAGNVSSTIVSQNGGLVQVAATGTISGSVTTSGQATLTAPVVSEQLDVGSVTVNSPNQTLTGTSGGVDAGSLGGASNVTQEVLGATQQVASNIVTDNNAATTDDEPAEDGSTDGKKKKAKDKGAVYDFANQFIDNLISGKPTH